jgi:hypothetical protein
MMTTTMREMKRSDLFFAVECARAAGRISVTAEELESSLLYDANGCFVAESGRGPAGFCIAGCYGKYGFLNAIAQGGIRGKAIVERRLTEHAVAYLSKCGCEHTFADAGNFLVSTLKSAGFMKLGRILRFVGSIYARCHQHVRAMRPQDLSAIGALDRHSFGGNRWYFLKRRYSLTPQFCKVLDTSGTAGGYIMARRARGAIVVGPWVVSPTVDCPTDLLEALALETAGEKLLVEVLETNRGAVELLRAMGFIESTEWTWRMRLGPGTNAGLANSLYAIGSPFIG